MARYSGKDGSVQIDGVAVGYVTDWSLTASPSFVTHWPSGDSDKTVYADFTDFSGSFTVEADASDSKQEALRQTDPVLVTVVLLEKSGVGWSLTAYAMATSNGIQRGTKVSRTYTFIDTGSVSVV